MKKVYVSNDKKPILGVVRGIKRTEQHKDGVVLIFNNDDNAYRAAQVLMNSGYETVKILEGEL